MQRGDDIDLVRQRFRFDGFLHAQLQELHAFETEFLRQFARLLHQLGAGLDTNHLPAGMLLHEEVVENEAEIGFAGPVVDQHGVLVLRHHLLQQRLDEMIEMIDLFQLAPRILIELAIARQDMQFLQQLDRLVGLDFRNECHGASLTEACPPRTMLEWGLYALSGLLVSEELQFNGFPLQNRKWQEGEPQTVRMALTARVMSVRTAAKAARLDATSRRRQSIFRFSRGKNGDSVVSGPYDPGA